MTNNKVTAVPLEEIKKLMDQGFNLKFIAQDLNIKHDSLVRRIRRAKRKGLWNE